MKNVKKFVCICLIALLSLSGCSNATEFDENMDIAVVSREEGSGTRGAFIELVGIEEKDANGKKVDHTTISAIIAKATDIMLSTVASDEYAIGYVSLGALNKNVKALSVNGIAPTIENIKTGDYEIARPFNIAYQGEPSAITQDFINFILSSEGQAIVEQAKYIKVEDQGNFQSNLPQGKIIIGGSTSVSPVIEKLKEAYLTINPNAIIEINTSDSTTGMLEAINGTCDIGMASRELKESELQTLTNIVIATDGIAVIVNPENKLTNLTKDQIKAIFTGNSTTWNEIH